MRPSVICTGSVRITRLVFGVMLASPVQDVTVSAIAVRIAARLGLRRRNTANGTKFFMCRPCATITGWSPRVSTSSHSWVTDPKFNRVTRRGSTEDTSAFAGAALEITRSCAVSGAALRNLTPKAYFESRRFRACRAIRVIRTCGALVPVPLLLVRLHHTRIGLAAVWCSPAPDRGRRPFRGVGRLPRFNVCSGDAGQDHLQRPDGTGLVQRVVAVAALR